MDFARLKKVVGILWPLPGQLLGPRLSRPRPDVAAPAGADFNGQTWVVTGATGGIGRAVVEGATSRGATVLALARSHEKLDALVRSCARSRARDPDRDRSLARRGYAARCGCKSSRGALAWTCS